MADWLVTFERMLDEASYRATSGQIVDSTLVSGPRQRIDAQKWEAIQDGRRAARSDRPAQATQKDTDARGTVKTGRRKPPGKTTRCLPIMAIPILGYQNHMAMDRTYGFIRHSTVTDAACHDGAICAIWSPVTTRHRRSGAGTAYRS